MAQETNEHQLRTRHCVHVADEETEALGEVAPQSWALNAGLSGSSPRLPRSEPLKLHTPGPEPFGGLRLGGAGRAPPLRTPDLPAPLLPSPQRITALPPASAPHSTTPRPSCPPRPPKCPSPGPSALSPSTSPSPRSSVRKAKAASAVSLCELGLLLLPCL